jgi:hypothetical protein
LVLINIVGDLFGVENWAKISARMSDLLRLPHAATFPPMTGTSGKTNVGLKPSESKTSVLDEGVNFSKAAQNLLKLKVCE